MHCVSDVALLAWGGLRGHSLAEMHKFAILHTLLSRQITGRVVILPSLWCGMDRWWAPHAGVIPGSALELPYRCPADHVLDLEA